MIGALIDHLWQSTLFCAAVWSITLALRENGAGVRHALWVLASVKFLVPFSALYTAGAAAGLPTPVESQPAFFVGTMVETFAAAAPVVSPGMELQAAQGLSPSAIALFALWLAGAAFVARRWFAGWRAANTLIRATRPAPGSPPDARITDEDVEPSVAGVITPVVLLPAPLLRRLPPAQLDAVLAHEREHIARNDVFKDHLHRLVETLFWFHPLVWWIGRRLVDERERACDEGVLARGYDPGDYAAGILAVCRHCRAAHARPAYATSGALAGDLTTRIRHILGSAPPVAVGLLKALALAVCTMAAATVPLFAGALDGDARRRTVAVMHATQLHDAIVYVSVSADSRVRRSLDARDHEVAMRNFSLRELVALTYDVAPSQVTGGGVWLDQPRYDFRVEVPGGVSQPDDLEPLALRGLVHKLLASRFDLQIRANESGGAQATR
jgi:beta-lactamase regulating signal transducer with metallopeptidase domain